MGEAYTKEIRVFDTDGTFIRPIGQGGEGPGGLRLRSYLAIDPKGRFLAWETPRPPNLGGPGNQPRHPRISAVYHSYHSALARLRAELLECHGRLWHINWHSMKSVGNAMTPDGEGAKRPDFVVGDLRGKSAHRSVTEVVVGLLEKQGYRVSVNDPYAGGLILKEMGDPAADVHSIQIEMNGGLYMDEVAVEKTSGFPKLRASLLTFTRRLADAVG